MKTILLSSDTKRVTVADMFRRMLALPNDGVMDVFTDSNDEIVEIRASGGRPWISEIQGEFLKFCQFKGVVPICAVTPWSNDYTGEGLQNGMYSISVDEFRMFAQPYEIEISYESALTPAAGKDEALKGASPGGGDWIAKAWEIANRIGLERWETGRRQITARYICEPVAECLALDETTHGIQGPRGSDNVRVEGLRGWKFTPPKKALTVD